MQWLSRFLALFLVIGLLLPGQVRAEEPEEPDFYVQLDDAFGYWVVNPLAAVMFFDLWFWDNTLPVDESIGQTLETDGVTEVVTEVQGRSLVFQELVEVDDPSSLVPLLTEPVLKRMGDIEIRFQNADQHQLEAWIPEQEVDTSPLEASFQRPGDGAPDSAWLVMVSGGPVPYQVDMRTGKTLEQRLFVVPEGGLPLEPGMHVTRSSGDKPHEVLEISAEAASLRSTVKRVADEGFALANPEDVQLPLVVAWLVFGAVFFTLRMVFINIRGFAHGVMVTAGLYDSPDDPGEISHFQALSSALSATVGLGNIAGVAIAVSMGGPGAIFWMVVAGILGMSSKFTECTLGQMYRVEKPDGTISGGPMHYLKDGLEELGLGPLGTVLAVLFAIMCIGGSFGGGNMFQANQSYAAVAELVPLFADYPLLYGVMLATCVALVILGGIKRIGATAALIVPVMCGVYVLAGCYILVVNAAAVPAAFGAIVTQAFTPEAGYGGVIGVLAMGFRRASFSNEAGVGSASIAHSAAATKEPVREGIVALLEPFIDTVCVCTMTGLVVVVSGAYQIEGLDGITMTSAAFATAIDWFPLVLSFAVVMFAFSTMISWSYYGEKCAVWLFGERARIPYKLLFLVVVVFGSVIHLNNAVTFSDMMILGMALPNILGAVLLSGKVKNALDDYWGKLHRGEFKTYQG